MGVFADLVVPVADLVQGTYAPILAFSDPGDGVVLQVPNYPPFRDAIATTERKLLTLPMRDDGTRHVFDMAELEKVGRSANPHLHSLQSAKSDRARVFP